MKTICKLLFLILAGLSLPANAQKAKNLVYVDKSGVLRYTKDGREAAFFGVNYTVPFAYGYRSHKALGLDIEKAIDADVAHMARLGLDAFRVHVWDVEISDSAGNLLQNEHLRLFDYLLMRLKERGIKILVTPIAFWGNGYPEPDEKTPGFATKYGKGPSVVKEEAFVAQENYLRQFFRHVNPYTKMTYTEDPDVIATEINNEPHHSGPRERTTEYVNRMAAAIRGAGWTKPVFYNISESPSYAGAVAAANVDGHSFQWYPTNLVAGHEQKGNFLPHVDRYYIPFVDSLPAFRNRARAVYEFDAGDVLQSHLYPAIARSFRSAGFQWATQFAYDPMATAYANTEYQTHFLNLVYTPAKAVSLLIAGKAFHRLPRNGSWGTYPTDTAFGDFRVSYQQDLSELRSDSEFYYSNNTVTAPKNAAALRHIAGVGSSSLVRYGGNGAYFLDRIAEGRWRLEVYPDVLYVGDPFAKASPSREAVRVQWYQQPMELQLPGLGTNFRIAALHRNDLQVRLATAGRFDIMPGVYELSTVAVETVPQPFYAPQPYSSKPAVVHRPPDFAAAGTTVPLQFELAGVTAEDRVSVEIRNSLGRWKTVPAERRNARLWTATIPSEMLQPGILEYRLLQQGGSTDNITYPAAIKGYPYAWDYVNSDTWKIFVNSADAPLVLFDAARDRERIVPWIGDWRNNSIGYTSAETPGRLLLRASMNAPKEGSAIGWQQFIGDRINTGAPLTANGALLIRGRSSRDQQVLVSVITRDGNAWSAVVTLHPQTGDVVLSTTLLQRDSLLLLPRPYPGFQPLWFRSVSGAAFDMRNADKIEVRTTAVKAGEPLSIEIESIWFRKEP
jgi:hypothetical protein